MATKNRDTGRILFFDPTPEGLKERLQEVAALNKNGLGTDPALLGPFWRGNSPPCKSGETIARDAVGEPLEVSHERLRAYAGERVAASERERLAAFLAVRVGLRFPDDASPSPRWSASCA